MSNNLRLDNTCKYQVWITSWPEDGSAEARENEAACSMWHAQCRLVGQTNSIEEAVSIYNIHKDYDPFLTKSVSWQTIITDITEQPK